MKKLFIVIFMLLNLFSHAQYKYTAEILILPDEKWWGGLVETGSKMPFSGFSNLFPTHGQQLHHSSKIYSVYYL